MNRLQHSGENSKAERPVGKPRLRSDANNDVAGELSCKDVNFPFHRPAAEGHSRPRDRASLRSGIILLLRKDFLHLMRCLRPQHSRGRASILHFAPDHPAGQCTLRHSIRSTNRFSHHTCQHSKKFWKKLTVLRQFLGKPCCSAEVHA